MWRRSPNGWGRITAARTSSVMALTNAARRRGSNLHGMSNSTNLPRSRSRKATTLIWSIIMRPSAKTGVIDLIRPNRFFRRDLDEHPPTGLQGAPWMAGIAQLVERQVVVLDVTGSSPVARPTHVYRPGLNVTNHGTAGRRTGARMGGEPRLTVAVGRYWHS